MTEATALILQQWGVAGALLLIAGYVIVKLWSDTTGLAKRMSDQQAADIKALTAALADSNSARISDHQAMTTQLLRITADSVSGLTTAANANEASATANQASTIVLSEVKQSLRDFTEEFRRRPNTGR